jgi:hypothetical protein
VGFLTGNPDVSTETQIKQNRINSLKSTGPKTLEGKRRASQNAYKHGLRAQREQVVSEESLAFESRMQSWNSPDGDDDVNEFLLHDNVSLSFEIERLKRSLVERRRRNVENAEIAEIADVHDMGAKLFHDRTGPTATYGTRRWGPKNKRVSWQEKAADPDRPAELVRKLCSSANGCVWLLEEWDALKERLCSGPGFWVASDKFKGARLLGREPVDAIDDRRVANMFAAAHALFGAGKPFDDLISDMSQGALDSFERRVTKVHRDLVGRDDPKRARQILIDLVEENIAELEEKLAEHNENGPTKVRRDDDYNGFDDSRAGQALNGQLARCRRLLDRGRNAFLKHREKRGAPLRDSDGTGVVGPHPPLRDSDGTGVVGPHLPLFNRGRGGAAFPVCAIPDSGTPGCLASQGDAAFAERTTTMVEIHTSDVLACVGFLPERVVPRALDAAKLDVLVSNFETDGGTGAARDAEGLGDGGTDERMREEPRGGGFEVAGEMPLDAAPGTASGGDLTSAQRGSNCRNSTNEADFCAGVSTSENQELVAVTADSGDVSGLDNLRTKPVARGRAEDGGRTAEERDRRMGDRGGAGDGAGLVEPQPAGPRDTDGAGLFGRGLPLAPTSAADLLEMEQTLFEEIERLKAEGAPVDELLNDVLAVSRDFHAFLDEQHPREP